MEYELKFKIGTVINSWTVISEIFRNKWNKKSVTCKCSCGKVKDHELSALHTITTCRKCYFKSREKSKYQISEYKRFWNTKKKYNIDKDTFLKMWERQNGKCSICGKLMTNPESKRGQKMSCVSIDHNHSTNIVRELLCYSCNKGIGHFNENPIILLNAINYLKKHEKVSISTSS